MGGGGRCKPNEVSYQLGYCRNHLFFQKLGFLSYRQC